MPSGSTDITGRRPIRCFMAAFTEEPKLLLRCGIGPAQTSGLGHY
ncbi:hypothetical protein GON09_005289 [Rhodococcus sp. B50]|nr:hypothetical protein [Rhodococcus sp. B50]